VGLADLHTQTITTTLSNPRVISIPNSNNFVFLEFNPLNYKVSLKISDQTTIINTLEIGFALCTGSYNLDFKLVLPNSGVFKVSVIASVINNISGTINCQNDLGKYQLISSPFNTPTLIRTQNNIFSGNPLCTLGTVKSSEFVSLLYFVVLYLICGGGSS
jgi:hypothetical protein